MTENFKQLITMRLLNEQASLIYELEKVLNNEKDYPDADECSTKIVLLLKDLELNRLAQIKFSDISGANSETDTYPNT